MVMDNDKQNNLEAENADLFADQFSCSVDIFLSFLKN